MKKITIIIAWGFLFTIFFLSACSTDTNMDSHSMDNGEKMEWKTHTEKINTSKTLTWNLNVDDEENVIWEAQTDTMHTMDDGRDMEWTKESMH